jgi:hypothetical protein
VSQTVQDHKDIVDIGPECFGYRDGSVLCWKGENYTPQRPTLRVRAHNLIVQMLNATVYRRR